MGTEFIVNGASGRNPGVDSAIELQDTDGTVFKIKATEDVGLTFLRNGVRTNPLLRVQAKTASYTVLVSDNGTFFTTEGSSGAVTFTLPATASLPVGWYADFYNAADQDMIIATGTADTGVAFNEIDADSVAISTTAEQLGTMIRAVKMDTLVAFIVMLGAETVTPTVAD